MTAGHAPAAGGRRRAARWLLAAAAATSAILLVEFGLRNVGGVFHDTFMMPDYYRGWVLKPGFSGWISDENTLWVTINSDGLRDREHPLEVPPDTVRIAVLGDSYMQGINVPREATFPTFLEDAVARCLTGTGRVAETLNFGVSGYGTAQELLTFRHHAAKYRPNVVLLAVYTGNDVFNNRRDLNPQSYSEQSPYFTLRDGRLELNTTFREVLAADAAQPQWRQLRIRITDRYRTAQLVHQFYGWLRPYVVDAKDADAEQDESSNGRFDHVDDEIYRPSLVPEVVDAWQVTEALLVALAREVQEAGAEFWIVTLANAAQLEPDLAARAGHQKSLGVDSLYYPDRRIRALAERHGIPVITLAERLADLVATKGGVLNGGYNDRYPLGSGHWNEVGNRTAAEMTGEQLCAGSSAIARLRE